MCDELRSRSDGILEGDAHFRALTGLSGYQPTGNLACNAGDFLVGEVRRGDWAGRGEGVRSSLREGIGLECCYSLYICFLFFVFLARVLI